MILELKDIVKTFPGVRALDGVDFALERGEVHALCGENGAGKSTLMHIIGGVLQPDAGTIMLDGEAVSFVSPRDAAQRGIAVVFQERSLSANLTIAENIFANRQPLRLPLLNMIDRGKMERDAAALMKRFCLDVPPGTLVAALPAALQQLVEILKAVSIEPRVLILDEPTSTLTATETDLLFQIIREVKQSGVAVIYISHHLPEVFAISDRVTIFRDGRHVHTCATAAITERELVNKMVGRTLEDLYGTPHGTAGDECLRIENASRGTAFRDVSFAVRRGEIVGMAGLAGAGRTELARGIFGAEPFDAGRVFVDGTSHVFRSPADAISHGVAYLTEDRKNDGLFLDMALRTNCPAASLGKFARGGIMDDESVASFAADCVQQFGIVTPGIDQKVLRLSGGNQQKVLLALWLATKPKVLIVDEPTRGVDVGARSDIYHRLRQLAAQGTAILMISSDLPEVLGMSDRILVMRNGRIVRELAAAEASEELVIAYATGVGECD